MGDVTTSGVVAGPDSRGRYADMFQPDCSRHCAVCKPVYMQPCTICTMQTCSNQILEGTMQPCTVYCARYALCRRVPTRQYKAEVPTRLKQTNMKQTPPICICIRARRCMLHADICCMQRTNQIFISLSLLNRIFIQVQ